MSTQPNNHAANQGSFRRGLVMGALGFVVLGIGVISFFRIFGGGVKVYTQFPDVDGLRLGAEVRVSGVKVGQVERIRLLDVASPTPETPLVEVEMMLEKEIAGQDITSLVYKDSVAILRTEGSLADRVVDIQVGTPASGRIRNGDHLKGVVEANLELLQQRGESLKLNLDTARTTFLEAGEKIKQGRGTFGAILHRKELKENLNQLTRELAAFDNALNSGGRNIGKLRSPQFKRRVEHLQNLLLKLSDNFTAGHGTGAQLVHNAELRQQLTHLADSFGRVADRLSQIQKRYQAGEGSLGKFIKDKALHEQLRRLRTHFENISAGLDRGEGTAGKLLQDPRLSRTLGDLSSEILETLYDMRQTPSHYIRLRFSLF